LKLCVSRQPQRNLRHKHQQQRYHKQHTNNHKHIRDGLLHTYFQDTTGGKQAHSQRRSDGTDTNAEDQHDTVGNGGRIVGTLHLEDDCGERACMSVIERVSLPFRRSCVYWTKGHGEASFDDYGPFGLSNISRDLALDGYGNKTIDLTSGDAIADDCALVVVAGAKNEFSTAEMNRLRNYLEGRGGRSEGGRLLVLLDSAESGGLSTLLSEWGIRPMAVA